jgi:hypothetical protein
LSDKIYHLVETGWRLYITKVAGSLLEPENEKMMQLQLASVFQTLAVLYESSPNESIKVLLEVPVSVRANKKNIIDIVIHRRSGSDICYVPIELKCFRLMTRDGKAKRGGGNLMMYDYWEDIENIELYSSLDGYSNGVHLALTDDPYIVENEHKGEQVRVYSTSRTRGPVSGVMEKEIKNRAGLVSLKGTYDMARWESHGQFFAIMQTANGV